MSPVLSLLGASVPLSGRTVLHALDVQVHAGERIALVGANGSGKSTLLRTLHGLVPMAQGERRAAPGLRMAMLFQRPHLLRCSVLFNLTLAIWLDRQQPRRWADARALARQALARVGLLPMAARLGSQLSGGQQQRVALARAWARQPEVLLLDEPTASLDPHAKQEVEDLILEFAQGQAQPMTLLWASHNLGQVKRIATRVLYLERGRVLADLPVQDFFNAELLARVSPSAHAFVQGEKS